jgi:hypothetical protein
MQVSFACGLGCTEADAHCMDSQTIAPVLSVALLLPVGFADISGLFAGYGRLADTPEPAVLALEDFFHVSLIVLGRAAGSQ